MYISWLSSVTGQLYGLPVTAGGHRDHHQAPGQAAEVDGSGRAAPEATQDELHYFGDDLQPGRPAHEAAAHQLSAWGL